jgi:hypothetical protein
MMVGAFSMCLGGRGFRIENYCDTLLRQYCGNGVVVQDESGKAISSGSRELKGVNYV